MPSSMPNPSSMPSSMPNPDTYPRLRQAVETALHGMKCGGIFLVPLFNHDSHTMVGMEKGPPNQGLFNTFGGKVKKGSTWDQTLREEVQEEMCLNLDLSLVDKALLGARLSGPTERTVFVFVRAAGEHSWALAWKAVVASKEARRLQWEWVEMSHVSLFPLSSFASFSDVTSPLAKKMAAAVRTLDLRATVVERVPILDLSRVLLCKGPECRA